MLYLGIDQHARQLTVSLRDEAGDVLLARQVSTEPDRVQAFFAQLTRDRVPEGGGFVAVLEVCGFNDWLIRLLHEYRCHKVILIQPEDRKKRKTDRRDAAALSELLWANRERLLHGKPVRGLRQVEITDPADQENRRLTTLRKEAGVARARLINKVKWVLRRPTRGGPVIHAGGGAGVHGPVPGLPGRAGRAVPAGPQPGELLGAHARLPEQRGERPAAGPDHQGGQRHRPVAAGPAGPQGAPAGRPAAGL